MSTAVWIGLIITFFLIILSVAIIIIVIRTVKKTTMSDVPPNSPLMIRFSPGENGHAVFVLKNIKSEVSTSDRVLVEAKPLDIEYDEDGEPINVDTVTFSIRKECLVSCPRGTISLKRDIYFISPQNSTDLTERFRNTKLGQKIVDFTNDVNTTDYVISSVVRQQERQRKEVNLLDTEQDKISKQKDVFIKQLQQNKEPRVIERKSD